MNRSEYIDALLVSAVDLGWQKMRKTAILRTSPGVVEWRIKFVGPSRDVNFLIHPAMDLRLVTGRNSTRDWKNIWFGGLASRCGVPNATRLSNIAADEPRLWQWMDDFKFAMGEVTSFIEIISSSRENFIEFSLGEVTLCRDPTFLQDARYAYGISQ